MTFEIGLTVVLELMSVTKWLELRAHEAARKIHVQLETANEIPFTDISFETHKNKNNHINDQVEFWNEMCDVKEVSLCLTSILIFFFWLLPSK